MQYPLSRDEHAAMFRYLSGIKKQLQDVSDLLTARYGENSSIAALATGSLVSAGQLQREFSLIGECDSATTPFSARESSARLPAH